MFDPCSFLLRFLSLLANAVRVLGLVLGYALTSPEPPLFREWLLVGDARVAYIAALV